MCNKELGLFFNFFFLFPVNVFEFSVRNKVKIKPALWRPLVAIIQHPDSTEPEKGMQIGKSRGGGGGGVAL